MEMINWPAVIKYEGQDELAYVSSRAQLGSDAESHAFSCDHNDFLIDGEGCIYSLESRDGRLVRPVATGKTVTLGQFTRLVRLHAATAGECCTDKIVFDSISEGVCLVGRIGET